MLYHPRKKKEVWFFNSLFICALRIVLVYPFRRNSCYFLSNNCKKIYIYLLWFFRSKENVRELSHTDAPGGWRSEDITSFMSTA